MTGIVEPDYEVFQLDITGNSLSSWWKGIKSWNPMGDDWVKKTEISFELLPEIDERNGYKKETIKMRKDGKWNIFISQTTELCFILAIKMILLHWLKY